jgi:hypothetical protein
MNKGFAQRVVLRDLSQFNVVYLVPLADFHEGSRDADHEVSNGYIEWIRSHNNAFTLLNGDMMNCAWKESTPELFEDLITPDAAYEKLRARLMPIKNKILMLTRGGHEGTIFRKVGADYMARLAYDLGDIPYMPDGGMFGLKLGKNNHTAMVWGYATHGWGGARTIGAKIKKVEDLANIANVDIIILSHDHTQAIHRLNVLDPPRSRLNFKRPMHWKIQRKLLINTGGFVKYAGYIQNKGYTPQDLGTPRIRIELKNDGNGYHLDLHASI